MESFFHFFSDFFVSHNPLFQPFYKDIELSSLSEIYQIDSGSNAKVYSVKYQRDRYALKVIPKSNIPLYLNLEKIPEIEHLAILSRCNLIGKMITFFEDQRSIFILFQLYEQNLERIIHSSDYFLISLETKIKWFRQIVLAVNFCHCHNICHLDIKLSNIMIDNRKQIRLIDFGCSRKVNFPFEGELTRYSAPELILKQNFVTKAIDVWALGVVFFRMLTGQFPFQTSEDIINSNWNPELIPSRLSTLFFSIFTTGKRWKTIEILYFFDNQKF